MFIKEDMPFNSTYYDKCGYCYYYCKRFCSCKKKQTNFNNGSYLMYLKNWKNVKQ